MKQSHFLSQAKLNRGFSLIELMVSLVIGLVIMVASLSAYMGAANSGKVADAQSRMNEDGQAALNILSQHIRMTGSNPVRENRDTAFPRNFVYDTTYVGGSRTVESLSGDETATGITYTYELTPSTRSTMAILGCDGKLKNIGTAGGALNAAEIDTCATSAATAPDSIGISYEADSYNTTPSSGLPTDCLGFKLSKITAVPNPTPPVVDPVSKIQPVEYFEAINRFYIENTADIPSLKCKGNGGSGTAQPLVENIEDMQLLYGVVSTTDVSNTATIAGYLRADEVTALKTTTVPPALATAWGKVAAVRICVLVRSDQKVTADAVPPKYRDCNDALVDSAADLHLRRAYRTTVVLRNRVAPQ